jgi:hypothetical protein
MLKVETNIANKPSLNRTSPESLRIAFDTAIAQVQPGRGSLSRSRTPIFVRQPGLTADAAEKQALSQAARALAQLWNVSPKLGR